MNEVKYMEFGDFVFFFMQNDPAKKKFFTHLRVKQITKSIIKK
jgi:hypothetical protein